MAGPITVVVFAVLGWVMKQLNFSIPAAVIGLLLGKMAETELLHSYQISGGEWTYILERPIAIGLFILMALSVFLPPLLDKLKNKTPA